jgi:acetolactate decarboxylase
MGAKIVRGHSVKIQWYQLVAGALAVLLLITMMALIYGSPVDRDVLYQVSALDILANGSYDGITTAGDLKQHGDFGMGTFDGLNGEMVVSDGAVYQVTADGAVRVADDTAMIPFAAVTYFDPDVSVRVDGKNNLSAITSALDDKLPSKNVFYAVRIQGTFPYVKARSVPAQDKPYQPLSEVVKNQSVFELHDVKGTIVGIYSPAYAGGIESAGYHLHFIADDHLSGGHVLDLTADNAEVQLDDTPRLYLAMMP